MFVFTFTIIKNQMIRSKPRRHIFMLKNKIRLDDVKAIIFDFDGVLTNNTVMVDQLGGEWVSCSRSDGLAFDALKKTSVLQFIVSSEKNKVVSARARKINVPVLQGISDKVKAITKLAKDNKFSLDNVIYVGNDLNDYRAMKICGYSACPQDSHFKIKELSDVILRSKGGGGIVRELVEDVLDLDVLEILYPEAVV